MRLLMRMKKPNYTEPAIGWNTEDAAAGVIKYGVANYEPRQGPTVIKNPIRPPLPAPELPASPPQCAMSLRQSSSCETVIPWDSWGLVLCIIRIILYYLLYSILY